MPLHPSLTLTSQPWEDREERRAVIGGFAEAQLFPAQGSAVGGRLEGAPRPAPGADTRGPPHLLDRLVHGLLEDPGHEQRDARHQQEEGQRPRRVEAAPAHSARGSRAGRRTPATRRKEGRPGTLGRRRPGREGAASVSLSLPGAASAPPGAAPEPERERAGRAQQPARRTLGRALPAAARAAAGAGRGGG